MNDTYKSYTTPCQQPLLLLVLFYLLTASLITSKPVSPPLSTYSPALQFLVYIDLDSKNRSDRGITRIRKLSKSCLWSTVHLKNLPLNGSNLNQKTGSRKFSRIGRRIPRGGFRNRINKCKWWIQWRWINSRTVRRFQPHRPPVYCTHLWPMAPFFGPQSVQSPWNLRLIMDVHVHRP